MRKISLSRRRQFKWDSNSVSLPSEAIAMTTKPRDRFMSKYVLKNEPFPSCCLSRFRSESWCSTFVREMSLICIRIRNSLPFEWLCTRTRFETEACSNSEMGYCVRERKRIFVFSFHAIIPPVLLRKSIDWGQCR